MFSFNYTIRFSDCDPAGIIFFSRIFEICHSAYEALIDSFGLEEDYWNNPEYVTPIVHAEAAYRLPFKYRDKIRIETAVSVLKESSFEFTYKCFNEKGELCCTVKTVHVFTDRREWKKTEIKNDIREKLKEHSL